MNTKSTFLATLIFAASAFVVHGQPAVDRPQRRVAATDFTSTPLPKDDAEQKILGVLNEMNQSQRRGTMSVPQEDGRLLRLLAESIGARHVVELGTFWYSSMRTRKGTRITSTNSCP